MTKERLSQKWAVASFFDDLPVGLEFAYTETPLHATLAGVFALKGSGDEIADILKTIVADTDIFHVTSTAYQQWGEALTVSVLERSDAFDHLYQTVQQDLISAGAVFNEPQYLGDSFTPHVTVQKTEQLAPGETKAITNVSLIDMFPNQDGYRRRIHAVIRLSNGE